MRAIKFGTMMATLAATDQRGDRFILDTCQALAAQRCLSLNPPKRCTLELTPGLMGKGGRTGQARFQ